MPNGIPVVRVQAPDSTVIAKPIASRPNSCDIDTATVVLSTLSSHCQHWQFAKTKEKGLS